MADITYRGNLKAASFPFLSELFGKSVIVRGQDNNYVQGLAAKEALDSSAGVPQIYYCHNVIPTDNGYRSVSYDVLSTEERPSTAGFDNIITLRDSLGNSAFFATDAVGNCYVMETGSVVWASPTTPPSAASIAGKRVTVAFVSGVSYIYFSGVGCYTYDFSTGAMSSVTLTGLVAADILGVIGILGYLIAYSVDSLAWSSTVDATDFTPSLTTGAGGGQVEGIRGLIVTIEEVYSGAIIFASDNAVAMQASGNPRFPFQFVPIPGAGGLADADYTTKDSGAGTVYAYTESGVQSITLRGAQVVFPEVTDFLSGSLFENYNETTDSLEVIDAAGTEIKKHITLISDRYVIVSYGIQKLTHALYFDIAYKQWGRLKIDHTNCFEIIAYQNAATELPKKSIAFLTSGGGIYVLNSDIQNVNANGVMLLGKFQYVRTRLLQLQGVEFENVNQDQTFELLDLPTLDGKNFLTAVPGYLFQSNGRYREFKFHNTAVNHTIVAKGGFNAVSFQLIFNVTGGR
jgi:hypothetical protein